MASSLVATGVQFPDNSVQTTAAVATPSVIPAGTVMLFAQTAAPTGFTKNTSAGNQHAIRVVTGAAGSGGSVDFTTAFASKPVTGTVSVSGSTGNHTLTIPQIPSHSHPVSARVNYTTNPAIFATTSPIGSPSTKVTNNTGGGGAHAHPLTISSSTFSGNAINLAVRFVDVIRATKD